MIFSKNKIKKPIIGCTTGIFDLFHIGHLKILELSKQNCDHLIVGVTTDGATYKMKGVRTLIPFEERIEIVKNIRFVDQVIPKTLPGFEQILNDVKFDVFFKGGDWKDSEKGIKLEKKCAEYNIKVKYFPYTNHISSTMLREKIVKQK